jgi:hypothetical protein
MGGHFYNKIFSQKKAGNNQTELSRQKEEQEYCLKIYGKSKICRCNHTFYHFL